MHEILGNKKLLLDFSSKKSSNRLPHAFIIEGKKGSGKKTLARALTAMINCEDGNAPCGVCPSCQKIFSSSHSDVYEVLHEDTSEQIKVAVVRDMISKAYLLPGDSEHTVFILENAQCMNQNSQNALLKLLEEPPKYVIFFLLTDNKKGLLPTILSRSVILRTESFSASFLTQELEKRHPERTAEDIACAVSIASGSLGSAEEILESDSLSAMREKVLSFVEESSKKSRSEATLSEIFSPYKLKKPDYLLILPLISLAMRDIATFREGVTDPLFFTSDTALASAAEGFSLKRAVRLYDEAESLNASIRSNPNMLLLGTMLNISFAK